MTYDVRLWVRRDGYDDGDAVVIPKFLRAELLKKIHASHLGVDSMCRRARDSLFWPGLKNEIRNLAAACDACQTYRPAQQREPLMGKPIPSRPWQVIHQDLFTWNNRQYLVTVDGFSGYFELDHLGRDTTTENLIRKTKTLFSRCGRPDEIHTDSDPRYLSAEFQNFLRNWQTAHKASSPHHHQSNGKSENGVKAAKRLVKKCSHLGQCLNEVLLEWRLTQQIEGLSPAEKFFGRKRASTILTRVATLTVKNADRVVEVIARRRQKQKLSYDKNTKPLRSLTPGEKIRIQPSDYTHEWKLGTCIEKVNSRTYRIQTEDGSQFIRNRRYLAAIPASPSESNTQSAVHRSTEPTRSAEEPPRRSTRLRKPTPRQSTPPRPSRKRPATTPARASVTKRRLANTGKKPGPEAAPRPRMRSEKTTSKPTKDPAKGKRRTPSTNHHEQVNDSSSSRALMNTNPTPKEIAISSAPTRPTTSEKTSRRGRPIITPAKLKL